MEFVHNRERGCFQAWVDGELAGETFYHLEDAAIDVNHTVADVNHTVADFNHTVVPDPFAGRGIASALVRYAMDEVRAEGAWEVRATCTYVAGWFTKHPEYPSLLVDGPPSSD